MAGRGARAALAATLLVGCGRTDGWPGHDQAEAFQEALADCLSPQGIAYRAVVARPGSRQLVVPAPVPDAWWAAHGGYGLLGPQRAETELDLGATDPNAELVARPSDRRRLEAALWGPAGTADAFAPDRCYDRALRTAGHLDASRRGTGADPDELPAEELAATVEDDPAVRAAHRRFVDCMVEAGHDEALARDPRAELARRFADDGLLDRDGEPDPDAEPGRRARAVAREEAVALDEVACRRTSGLDRSTDVVLRRLGARP